MRRHAGTPSELGIALITVLLVASLIFVAGMGLTLVLTVGQLVARNHREAAMLQAAAHAGIALAADSLARVDWQAALSGALAAEGADGAPAGMRVVDATPLDLTAETHVLNCGRPAPCSAAELSAVSLERPWGANNSVWQLYLFGPLASFAGFRHPPSIYLLVWVADDGRETDGRPDVDGGEPAGRHVLRARAMAAGREGTRRIVEAELVRICLDGRSACEPGIRVQSEREIRHALP
jgi:hypothetical protein